MRIGIKELAKRITIHEAPIVEHFTARIAAEIMSIPAVEIDSFVEDPVALLRAIVRIFETASTPLDIPRFGRSNWLIGRRRRGTGVKALEHLRQESTIFRQVILEFVGTNLTVLAGVLYRGIRFS